MCRAGGRRCPSSGGKGHANTSGPSTNTAAAPGSVQVVTDSPGRQTTQTPVKTPPPEAFAALGRAAQQTAATRSGGSVPTRERTDELAAKIPADRKDAFGQPLDAWGRRQYALRESGYTGPIDGDGYPDTTSEHAETMRYMARQRGEAVDW